MTMSITGGMQMFRCSVELVTTTSTLLAVAPPVLLTLAAVQFGDVGCCHTVTVTGADQHPSTLELKMTFWSLMPTSPLPLLAEQAQTPSTSQLVLQASLLHH